MYLKHQKYHIQNISEESCCTEGCSNGNNYIYLQMLLFSCYKHKPLNRCLDILTGKQDKMLSEMLAV